MLVCVHVKTETINLAEKKPLLILDLLKWMKTPFLPSKSQMLNV